MDGSGDKFGPSTLYVMVRKDTKGQKLSQILLFLFIKDLNTQLMAILGAIILKFLEKSKGQKDRMIS